MKINFSKYHGAGNDFIIIDNREEVLSHDNEILFKSWCSRSYGVGADGIILLENHNQYSFEMVYFNADGNLGSMCGNGGRCVADFADKLGLWKEDPLRFYAMDGEHRVQRVDSQNLSLTLLAMENIEAFKNDFIVETGSPHYVKFVENLENLNVFEEGRKIRYSEPFKKKGINVNFVSKNHTENGALKMRTYERGVENETNACGTGTVAVAMVARKVIENFKNKSVIPIQAAGGNLSVHFENDGIWLTGPVKKVYTGELTF